MRKRSVGLFVALLLSLAVPAFAHQGTSEIGGRISDQQGAVLPGVTHHPDQRGPRGVPRRDERTATSRNNNVTVDGDYNADDAPGTSAGAQGQKTLEVFLEIFNITKRANVV